MYFYFTNLGPRFFLRSQGCVQAMTIPAELHQCNPNKIPILPIATSSIKNVTLAEIIHQNSHSSLAESLKYQGRD